MKEKRYLIFQHEVARYSTVNQNIDEEGKKKKIASPQLYPIQLIHKTFKHALHIPQRPLIIGYMCDYPSNMFDF